MAELVNREKFKEDAHDKMLVLDTCVLIELMRCPELQQLFAEIVENGGRFMITTDVYGEFLRNAVSSEQRRQRNDLINRLLVGILQGIDAFCLTDAGAKFQLLLQNIRQKEKASRNAVVEKNAPDFKPSIVDERLLFLARMSFGSRQLFLVTENFNDVPLQIFDVKSALTISDKAGLRSMAMYAIDNKALDAALKVVK